MSHLSSHLWHRLMLFNLTHIARHAARLAVLATLVVTLAGCQGIVGSPSLSQIRIVDASPDAPGLDIYEGTTALAYNLGFGTVTSYVPLTPDIYTISANSAGTKQVLSSSKATLVASAQYTVLIGNSAASLQQVILKDQSQAAPSGQIALRVLDQSLRITAVDIYLVPAGQKLTGVSPLVTDITFGTNTGYLNIPAGAYTIVILNTGTIPSNATVPLYTGAQVSYSNGAARTIILIDQQLITTTGLQVIMADDFDSPTATN